MVQAGDPLEPRFKMTVGTAQAGGLFQCGVAIAAPHFFAKLLRRCATGKPLKLARRILSHWVANTRLKVGQRLLNDRGCYAKCELA